MFIHDESTDEIETFKTRNLTRTTSRDLTPDPTASNLNPHAGLFNNPMCPPAPMPTQSRMTSAMFFQQQQPQVPAQPTYSQMLFKQPDAKIQSAWLPRSGSTDSSASLGSSPTVPQETSRVSKMETAWRPRQVSSESYSSDSKEMKTDWRPRQVSSESTASNSTDSKEKSTTKWPPLQVNSSSNSVTTTTKTKETLASTTTAATTTTPTPTTTSSNAAAVVKGESSEDKKSKEDTTSSSSTPSVEEDDALAALAAKTAALALDF